MGIANNKIHGFTDHLKGSDGRVALVGGYLYIYLTDKLIHIAGIPSPYLLAARTSDSLVENIDDFVDDQGNAFEIIIDSSITGIEWSIQTYPDDESIIQNLRYEIKLNEN